MSKGHVLRVLVSERLAAAAEDIFVLFERTMAEYEEELSRSKEENRRKQQLLDLALSPSTDLVCGNVHLSSMSPDPGLDQDLTETPWIKEELEETSVKHEDEQLLVSVSESSGAFVKSEECSQPGQDTSSETYIHSEMEGHTQRSSDAVSNDWRAPFSFSASPTATEADRDHYSQVQIRDRSVVLSPRNKCAPEGTALSESMSGADEAAEGKKHQCPFCDKRFGTKQILQRHIRIHTGEKPYSCLICKKAFSRKGNLDQHLRMHTGEKPYSCSFCDKTFAKKFTLGMHVRTHTGEKPFSCPICKKAFTHKRHRDLHVRSHTGERPYSCSICMKSFAQIGLRDLHLRSHDGEKTYSCSICNKLFAHPSGLRKHRRIHTGERPYSCSICTKAFVRKDALNQHERTHCGERPQTWTVCGETIPE